MWGFPSSQVNEDGRRTIVAMTRGGTSSNSRILRLVPMICTTTVQRWFSCFFALSWESYNTMSRTVVLFHPKLLLCSTNSPVPCLWSNPNPPTSPLFCRLALPPHYLRISFLCESFCEWLQIAPEDLLGQPLSSIVDPRDTQALDNAVLQVLAGGVGRAANSGRQGYWNGVIF